MTVATDDDDDGGGGGGFAFAAAVAVAADAGADAAGPPVEVAPSSSLNGSSSPLISHMIFVRAMM